MGWDQFLNAITSDMAHFSTFDSSMMLVELSEGESWFMNEASYSDLLEKVWLLDKKQTELMVDIWMNIKSKQMWSNLRSELQCDEALDLFVENGEMEKFHEANAELTN